MPQYIYTAKGVVTSTSAGSEDVAITVKGVPAASTVIWVKRIQVSAHTPNDNRISVRGYLTTSTVGGAVATVAVPKNPLFRLGDASVFIKPTTTATSTPTVFASLFEANFNARGVWEWIARDELDYFITYPSTYFTLSLLSTSASVTADVTLEWIE